MGDFPLNDDWAYGLNVRALAQENRLFFSDWPAMTLIAHTLWGALFCKVFGFSFTVLRFSTLLMGAFGMIGFYRLLAWAHLDRRMTLFFSMALLFNPFWLVLSNSFMTDVPFLAILFWSVLYFLKALERPTTKYLALATLFAVWACFIRQLGLIVPGVFMLLVLYSRPPTLRNLSYAFLPLIFCFTAVEGFTAWLKSSGRLPHAYTGLSHLWASFASNPKAIDVALERIGIALLTTGLFLFPVLTGIDLKKARRGWLKWLLLPISAYCIWMGWSMFPKGNVLYNIGLGPKLLKDAYWGLNADPELPRAALGALKGLAVAGALYLVLTFRIIRSISVRREMLRLFTLLFAVCYLGFICANSLLIDRYLFPFVPFLLLYTAPEIKQIGKTGLVMLGLWTLFGITATHDYLAWNRARWTAARQLEQTFAPGQIDGGFEYNGWYGTGPTSQKLQGLKSWWFVRDDERVISFGPVYGYETDFVVPYRRWLPPGRDSIFALRRMTYATPDSVWCDMERLTADSSAFEPLAGRLTPGNGETMSHERAHSGQYSIKTDAAAQFGATIALDTIRPFDRLVVSVWRYPADAEAGIVVTSDDATRAYYFEPANVMERDSAGWGRIEMALIFPEAATGRPGRFYLWNPSSVQRVWFDDLKLYRFRVK